jgi:hypothetical protein
MGRFFHSLWFVVLLWAAIFVAWGITMLNDWFFYIWWSDIVLHFAGGFWVFVLVRYLGEHYGIEIVGEHRRLAAFLAYISLVALAGVLWEFYELILDRYVVVTGFTYLAHVFEDTLLDLFMDMCGGIVAYLLYLKNGKN